MNILIQKNFKCICFTIKLRLSISVLSVCEAILNFKLSSCGKRKCLEKHTESCVVKLCQSHCVSTCVIEWYLCDLGTCSGVILPRFGR